MLYQARLFRIFQKILDDKVIRELPTTREIFDFAKFLLRKFFANAKENRKIFAEILFWKRNKDCFEIENGYGSYKYGLLCFVLFI
jgi:timeless